MNTIKVLIWYITFSINQWFGTDFGYKEGSIESETEVVIESSKSGMSSKAVLEDLPDMGNPLDMLEMPRYHHPHSAIINPPSVTDVNPKL